MTPHNLAQENLVVFAMRFVAKLNGHIVFFISGEKL
jgi:hypothetical protein